MPINQSKPEYVFTKHEITILKALGFKKQNFSRYTSSDGELIIACDDHEYMGKIVTLYGDELLGFDEYSFNTFGETIDHILKEYPDSLI